MMGKRGQTTQDFAIGVSVLLVAVIGAFVFTQGGALAVYDGSSPGVEQPQADRIASYLVANYSVDGTGNNLSYGSGAGTIDTALSQDESDGSSKKLNSLIESSGADVSSRRRVDPTVNVSIVNGTTLQGSERTPASDITDGGSWGEYRSAQPASASRVVTLSNYNCNPVCWLVVRVW